MGKMTIYVGIMSGVLLLFYLAGLLTPDTNSLLLNMILDPTSISAWNLSQLITFSISSLIAVVITVALLTSGKPDLVPMAGIALLVFTLGMGFLSVYSKLASIPGYEQISLLIFSPIMVMFVLTIVEWWRGITT